MGCATSKNKDGTKCNKDVCERRKMLTGFHMSRDADGIETNFQVAIERKAKKPTKCLPLKNRSENQKKSKFFCNRFEVTKN